MYLLLIFLPFLIMGLPIAFVIGLTSLFFFLIKDIPLVILVNRMFDGVDSFILLTIPLFILAGSIMNAGGMTDRLIRFSKLLIGRTRGGLALVNI
ncbi:MAG: TRAP transporter large permease subunit, partial [Candidatus Aerophobetes bacterium]|nr:TRAP transporter large permease subunit [Candidatus Aerophobetes bacterium]